MKRILSVVALLVASSLLSSTAVAMPSTVRVRPGAARAQKADPPSWAGDRHAKPSAYSWLGGYTPSDTYTMVEVRGLSPRAVIRTLGGVKRSLGAKTPEQALDYVVDHAKPDYSTPPVVQVHRLGHAVVVYGPYFILDDAVLARLGRKGTAVGFFTDVEYDTYLAVARHGRIIRDFDAGFRPPHKGALPQEKGLDWGARHQNIWATAWAFEERLSRTHVSQEWFEGTHPTVVLAGDQV